MDNQLMLIIVVAILVIICAAVGAWVYMKSIRSRRLKAKFGPEYDQTVERLRNRELADTELQDRERRVKRFDIVPLSMQDASQYRERWRRCRPILWMLQKKLSKRHINSFMNESASPLALNLP